MAEIIGDFVEKILEFFMKKELSVLVIHPPRPMRFGGGGSVRVASTPKKNAYPVGVVFVGVLPD